MDARSADRITYIRTSEALPELWIKEAYQGGCSLWAGGGGGSSKALGTMAISSLTLFVILPGQGSRAKTCGCTRPIISASASTLYPSRNLPVRRRATRSSAWLTRCTKTKVKGPCSVWACSLFYQAAARARRNQEDEFGLDPSIACADIRGLGELHGLVLDC